MTDRLPLVLVVDDSPEMRSLIDDVLTEVGYEVITASSGGGALSLLAERVPNLVITDLFMPGMDGFTLRSEMLRRVELARVPVIVLSAFWQRPSDTLDVADVIAKPLEVDELLSAVKRAIGSGDASSTGHLVAKRDELVARAKMASAQRQVQEAVRDVSVMDPTSELNRFEERVRREEAMARGMIEVAASSLEEEFASLEDADTEAEVESRLSQLRSGAGAGAGTGS